jgi:AcrR family transcriptional regulator
MPRPSQHIDRSLLASGRALFERTGCAGLSVRQLAEHAGVNPGMFHYHFKSKDNFLRTLLQQLYDEMFEGLEHEAVHDGPAIQRLRAALNGLARFVRDHRRVIARVWNDAAAGEPVARDFLRGNAPRHVRLLLALLGEAQAEGSVAESPALQRLSFVMGAVVAPLVIIPGFGSLGITAGWTARAIDEQALSDSAIEQRVELALRALAPTRPHPNVTPRRAHV